MPNGLYTFALISAVVGIISVVGFHVSSFTDALMWLFVLLLAVPRLGRYVMVAGNELRSLTTRTLKADRLRQLARVDPRPPFLVLRSFFDTQIATVDVEDRTGWGMFMTWVTDGLPRAPGRVWTLSFDVIAALTKAANAYGPVIAIGGEHLDEPKTVRRRDLVMIPSTEASWRHLFRVAADGCWAIFVFPSGSAGLIEEVTALRSLGVLDKTIVLMPPTPIDARVDGAAFAEVAASWSSVQTRWRSARLFLPDYRSEGMTYLPRHDLSVKFSHSLQHRSDSEALRVALDAMLASTSGNARPTLELMGDCDEIVRAYRHAR